MEVRAQSEFQFGETHLLEEDEASTIRLLQERGTIAGDFDPARPTLQLVPTTRVAQRQATRGGLDMRDRCRRPSPASGSCDRHPAGAWVFL
jgi:hypothetical protein